MSAVSMISSGSPLLHKGIVSACPLHALYTAVNETMSSPLIDQCGHITCMDQ